MDSISVCKSCCNLYKHTGSIFQDCVESVLSLITNVTSNYGIVIDTADIESILCLSRKDLKFDQCLLVVFWTKVTNEWTHYNKSWTEQFSLFNAELQSPSISVRNLIAIVKQEFYCSSSLFDEYTLKYNPTTLQENACKVCKKNFNKIDLINVIPSSIVNKIYQ